jgi:ribosomal protein L37AE/L43A
MNDEMEYVLDDEPEDCPVCGSPDVAIEGSGWICNDCGANGCDE